VEKDVLEQVLGVEVSFRHRCRDGHHCCEFEVNTQHKVAEWVVLLAGNMWSPSSPIREGGTWDWNNTLWC